MIKKINTFLSSLPMTIIGGIFLILSFIFMKNKINIFIDPAWITVIICGIPLLYLAISRLIFNKGINKISSALLITIALISAISIGELFAGGEVAFIMAIGAILEEITTEKAKKGIKNLINLSPVQGRKITDKKEEIVSIDKIKKGDILRVLPGEIIPVDGIIVDGESSIDQSIITGESIPIDKTINDEVFCGTINKFGSIDIKTVNIGENSSLQKLIKMIKDAEKKQAPMQRIADKTASYLVPISLIIAIIVGIVTNNIVRAITILVVFCPCALVLATPTAIMAGIGQATKYGVIIKSGEALETMGKVNTIAFDKTGTLTHGKLEVSDITLIDKKISETELLNLVASAESKSEHPLGKSIVSYASKNQINIQECKNFKMKSGKGIYAEINNKKIYCGNEKYLNENKINITEEVQNKLQEFQNNGKVSIIIAENLQCIGIIALSDVLRTESKEIIKKLSKLNISTMLLTGDNKNTANYFAKKIGIKDVKANLLPEEKIKVIKELQNEGKKICMFGDGVNDAPSLKQADIGISMGVMGSDISVDASNIVLMTDDVTKIPYIKKLSNATINTIKLSITLSIIINFIAIICSAMGILNPTTGALVHNAGSCFVVLIAALLHDRKFI